MDERTILNTHPELPITVRQFGDGATEAGEEGGITVIIDNFRASNTILALLEAGAVVTPVLTIEEALSYNPHIKVGEKGGVRYDEFDYDNSPFTISKEAEKFKEQNVVIRTTNGTRGIINAKGSKEILVGAFRNLDSVVDYCLPYAKKNVPISFVAMGSKDIPRIEDIYGAKMLYYRLLEKLDAQKNEQILASEDNPWNKDWTTDIKSERDFNEDNKDDREFSIQLNKTDIVPKYDISSKTLEPIKL